MKHSALLPIILLPGWTVAVHADDIDSVGVKIQYTVTGRGEPVILVHGLYVKPLEAESALGR